MLYLMHAGVGDVVLLCLQDNGVLTATMAPMGGGMGDTHDGTPGCWLHAPHPNKTYLEWWGDAMALLGHPAALGRQGLWVPVSLPWDRHPWLGPSMGTYLGVGRCCWLETRLGGVESSRGCHDASWGRGELPHSPSLGRLASSLTPEAN